MKKKTDIEAIRKAILLMDNGEEITIYAIEKDGQKLSIGIYKDFFFDGITVYLCGVYGSDSEFASFPVDCDTDEKDVANSIILWVASCADNLCGENLSHLKLG